MGASYNVRSTVRSGFSLVEMLIVITIMGILVGIASYGLNYIKEAREKTTITNLKAVKNAVDNYKRRTNQYPQKLNDLVIKPGDIASERQWGGPYFGTKDDPVDVPQDSWGNDFVYKYSEGAHPPYKLYSWGENGPGSPEDEWLYPNTKL